ncbi:MAG: DNA primase [Deltaproteobacteria bacterium]|nr:MAG: DNA primase [Deltaproteobacteria bacterium]
MLSEFIPDDKIADVRNTADIVDLISEYVVLKKVGKNFLGLCPFHAEKTPSFTVSPEKQIFHCFGCGQGGNVFNFVMQYQNLSFPEAVRFVAKKYGIEISARNMSAAQKRKFAQREKLFQINEDAVDYFRKALVDTSSGERGRKYLAKRRMTPEVIERFWLGYAPMGWNNIVRYFSSKKVPLDDVETTGLVIAKKGGYYDRFRDRIIFPILDIDQRVVGFGGRSLDNSLPKYLNSPETPVYHKRSILYGLHANKEMCRKAGSVFIVEGYFDLLSLYCHGIKNVVATLGTALTQEHLRILKGYAREFILVFDSDNAGIKAAERSLSLFAEEKANIRIVILPEGRDPDSYVFEVGSEGFLRRVERALGIMEFLIASAIDKYGLSPEGKIRIVDALKGPLRSLANGVSRSVYVRDLSERLNIDESVILREIRDSKGSEKKRVSPVKPQGGSRLEETLIAIMLQAPQILGSFNVRKIVASLETVALKKVGEMILQRVDANVPVTAADLIAQTEDPEIRNVISSLSLKETHSDYERALKIVGQYEAKLRKQEQRLLLRRIREAEKANNQELVHQLLAEKQERARELNRTFGKIKAQL